MPGGTPSASGRLDTPVSLSGPLAFRPTQGEPFRAGEV